MAYSEQLHIKDTILVKEVNLKSLKALKIPVTKVQKVDKGYSSFVRNSNMYCINDVRINISTMVVAVSMNYIIGNIPWNIRHVEFLK